MTEKAPRGLAARGRNLWVETTALHELDGHQLEVLLQACRLADRLNVLDTRVKAEVPGAMREERDSSQALARLLAALRLPDEKTGKRPQIRSVRGTQMPSKVTSLERALARPTKAG